MSSAAAARDDAPALAVDDLVAGYGGVIALDGVSISAGTAAITAVLGANGAGKTTLLRAVSGMIRPRRGRVLLDGADQTGRSPEQMVRAGVAHVPEGQGVIPELTVEENLRVGMMAWPPRSPRAERAAALDEAYERFRPLAERRRKLAATLSGGERQMLVIARALLARPGSRTTGWCSTWAGSSPPRTPQRSPPTSPSVTTTSGSSRLGACQWSSSSSSPSAGSS